jgi:hypothetical protein
MALEVVDVEDASSDSGRPWRRCPRVNLALDELLEVPPVVDLRQAVEDGHAVDLFVVGGLDVPARWTRT